MAARKPVSSLLTFGLHSCEASAEVMEENRAKSPMFAKVHDSFLSARKTVSDWVARSEGQYLAARNANI